MEQQEFVERGSMGPRVRICVGVREEVGCRDAPTYKLCFVVATGAPMSNARLKTNVLPEASLGRLADGLVRLVLNSARHFILQKPDLQLYFSY